MCVCVCVCVCVCAACCIQYQTHTRTHTCACAIKTQLTCWSERVSALSSACRAHICTHTYVQVCVLLRLSSPADQSVWAPYRAPAGSLLQAQNKITGIHAHACIYIHIDVFAFQTQRTCSSESVSVFFLIFFIEHPKAACCAAGNRCDAYAMRLIP